MKQRTPDKQHKDRRRGRSRSSPPLPFVSEEMKVFSAALAKEILNWPQVKTNRMFGFQSFYRRNNIFAALPETRAWKTPDSFMFKLLQPPHNLRSLLEGDPRIDTSESVSWFPFEVSTEADLNGALEWLSIAYEQAGRQGPGRSKPGTRRNRPSSKAGPGKKRVTRHSR